MELHAFEFVPAMAEAHDGAVIGLGGDGQLARQGFALDNEGMVARGRKGIGELAENVFAVVMDLAGLAVKDFRRANNFPSECRANGLMAEANAENRKFSRQSPNKVDADSGILRRAGTR